MAERDVLTILPNEGKARLSKIQDNLDLAKREIERGNAGRAIQLLATIQEEVEEYEGTAPWAEHALRIAEAFAAKAGRNDDSALRFFGEALERAVNLAERDDSLELHCHLSLGSYLYRTLKRRSGARQHYETAKQIATRLRLGEERIAEIELKIVMIDLEADEDDERKNFDTLKRAAAQDEYTWSEQLAAWHQHLGQSQLALRGKVFARKEGSASEAYFRSLLQSVRVARK
jgi:hypothetical protein